MLAAFLMAAALSLAFDGKSGNSYKAVNVGGNDNRCTCTQRLER
jgi:hypothetical protein